MNVFFILAIITAFATLGTLVAGVAGMTKDNKEAKLKSNKMMRARVGLQMLTLFFLLLAVAGD